MSTQTLPSPKTDREFQTPKVLAVTLAHFVHDTYPAFLAPLIPLLREELGLSLAMAGSLLLFNRMASLVQPLMGYVADRTGVRYFVILAPALTAMLLSSLGLAASYVALIPLLIFSGISHAMFHAPAPTMITRVSGDAWGKGMSYFMAGGELGRSFGPLFIVAVVELVGLQNSYVAAVPGVLASLVLFRVIGDTPAQLDIETPSIRVALNAQLRPLLLLLGILLLVRAVASFTFITFLPTYLTEQGTSFALAGSAVAVYEFAGVAGALIGGTLSDRVGRRTVFLIAELTMAPVLFAFLNSSNLLAMVSLLLLGGFVALSVGPVGMTVIQELFTENRSAATGLYIAFGMSSSSISVTLLGKVADMVGLPLMMNAVVLVPLLAIPLTLMLPETRERSRHNDGVV